MSSSDLSELESPKLSSEDGDLAPINKGKLEAYFKKDSTALPPKLKRKRAPSPPHEYTLADSPAIAQILMFLTRFKDAFLKISPVFPDYGPQDIEEGLTGSPPGEQVERILCGLLTLVLNRKKIPVEKGRYSRALEEAVLTHKYSWEGKGNGPWKGKNPLHGGGRFENMTPLQRLTMLQTLVMWCLDSSDEIREMIKQRYRGSRQMDDRNVTLAVQSWGFDGDRRRYWLLRGVDGTHFRAYRENDPVAFEQKQYSSAIKGQKHNSMFEENRHNASPDNLEKESLRNGDIHAETSIMISPNEWRSVAGQTDELAVIAARLKEDGSQAAAALAHKMLAAVPFLDRSEELRVANEQDRIAKAEARERRQARKAQFARPDPGFSLYAGRTRNKTVRYTYSDDEDDESSTRRYTRQSGTATPAEASGPTYTASGRQVRSRQHGPYGESILSNDVKEATSTDNDGEEPAQSTVRDDYESTANDDNDDDGDLSSRLESESDDLEEDDEDEEEALDVDAMELDRANIVIKNGSHNMKDTYEAATPSEGTEPDTRSLIVTLRHPHLSSQTATSKNSSSGVSNGLLPHKDSEHIDPVPISAHNMAPASPERSENSVKETLDREMPPITAHHIAGEE